MEYEVSVLTLMGFKEKAGDFGIKILNEYQYSIKDR